MKTVHVHLVLVLVLTLGCGTRIASDPDLAERIAASIPAGFNRPLVLGKSGTAVSRVWMQLRPDASCAVTLIEAAGKNAETKVERPVEESVFAQLVRDARSTYQTIHVDESAAVESDGRRLLSSWTGTKEWKDASETWLSIRRSKGLAVIAFYCTGTGSKDRLDALRATLKVDEWGD